MQLYVSSLNISLMMSLNYIGRNAMYFQSVKILWNKLFKKKPLQVPKPFAILMKL